jgi:uncharacterized protein DUF3551
MGKSLSLALLAAGMVLAAAAPAFAQTAYSYPWCAVYGDRSGAVSCYYASYAQCMRTLSGIGGYCMRSPYFGGGRY